MSNARYVPDQGHTNGEAPFRFVVEKPSDFVATDNSTYQDNTDTKEFPPVAQYGVESPRDFVARENSRYGTQPDNQVGDPVQWTYGQDDEGYADGGYSPPMGTVYYDDSDATHTYQGEPSRFRTLLQHMVLDNIKYFVVMFIVGMIYLSVNADPSASHDFAAVCTNVSLLLLAKSVFRYFKYSA